MHLKDGVTRLLQLSHALCLTYKNKYLFPSALTQIYLIVCSCQSLSPGILTLDILSYRNENYFMFLIIFFVGSNVLRMSSSIQIKTKTAAQKSKTCSLEAQPKPSDKLNPKTIDPVCIGDGGFVWSKSACGLKNFPYFMKWHAGHASSGPIFLMEIKLSLLVIHSLSSKLKCLEYNIVYYIFIKMYFGTIVAWMVTVIFYVLLP